jgi:hypothetical protein
MLRRILFACSFFLLTGCISTQTQPCDFSKVNNPVKHPSPILVYNFEVDPNQIKLNRSFTAKLIRHLGAQTVAEKKSIIANEITQVISRQVLNDLNTKHLTAINGNKVNIIAVNSLVIRGHILEIDQGNRLHRMFIGFGLGGSKIKTQIEIYQKTNTGLVLLTTFISTAHSSHFKPGIAPMTATVATLAGPVVLPLVVSTSMNTSAEFLATDVRKIATYEAREIADQITTFVKTLH